MAKLMVCKKIIFDPFYIVSCIKGTRLLGHTLGVINLDNCLAIVSAIVELQPDLGSVICVLIQHLAASAPDKTDYR